MRGDAKGNAWVASRNGAALNGARMVPGKEYQMEPEFTVTNRGRVMEYKEER